MFMRTKCALAFDACQDHSVRSTRGRRRLWLETALRKSHPVKPHREILRDLINARDLTLPEVAHRMGWRSPRAVAHKLKGDRDWASGELERMCEIVGITLIHLAEMSSDLRLTKTADALTAARIIDDATPAERERLMQSLLAYERAKRDSNR